jgi:hypothetical protein
MPPRLQANRLAMEWSLRYRRRNHPELRAPYLRPATHFVPVSPIGGNESGYGRTPVPAWVRMLGTGIPRESW